MSTNIKKTLAATLAASIAAGMVSVPAMADTTVDVDAIYAVAYNATVKAQETGKQEDINAARTAIAALEGTGAEFAIGEFSKLVDAPQQTILTKIVDGILEQTKAEVPSQEKINEIRAMVMLLPNQEWKNSYSSALDAPQQTLINNAVAAVEKAIETGVQTDIDAANKLLDSLETATNNEGVVKWAKAYQAEFNANKFALKVSNVQILNSSNVKISFNRAVDKTTVAPEDIKIANENDQYGKELIKKTVVSADGKSVIVTLVDSLKVGNYNVSVTGVQDAQGTEISENKNVIEYKAAEAGSIMFKKNNLVHNPKKEDILDFLIVRDSEGRDITNTLSLGDLEITSNRIDLVNPATGEISGDGTAIVTVKVKYTDLTTGAVTLNVETAKATTFKEAIFTKNPLAQGTIISKVSSDKKVDKIKVDAPLPVYAYASFLDQDGNEMPLDLSQGIDNKTPVIAGTNGAAIEGKQAGTLELVFNIGDAKGFKTFKVVPKSVDTGIKLTEPTMNLAPTKGITRIERKAGTVLVDQYNDAVAKGGKFRIEYKVGSAYINAVNPDMNNKALAEKVNTVGLEIDESTGDYTVLAKKDGNVEARVVYKNAAGKEFTAPLAVNVKGDKEVVKYDVAFVAGDNKIDLNAASSDKSFTLDVKGFNKNNANVGELSDLTYTVKKDGVEIVEGLEMTDTKRDVNQLTLSTLDLSDKGIYEVIIKDDTHTVKVVKIEVVNSTAVPTTAVTIANSIEVAYNDSSLIEEALKEILVVKDQYGNSVKVLDIATTDAFTDNKKENEYGQLVSYDIVFRKITINGTQITLPENIRVNVKITN